MQFSSPISKFLAATVLITSLLSLTSCGRGQRNKLEEARIEAILIHCRAYATDNDGKYPSKLSDLHPKYINLVSNFYSPPNSAAEEKEQAYYYRPGLNVGDKIDEPLIVSPHVIKGQVNVRYLGGFIRTLGKEEAQKILSNPQWAQEAPQLSQ